MKPGLFTELILASSSPARRSLLTALGVSFRSIAPDIDESNVQSLPVKQLVAVLAERKARVIMKQVPGALVIASDQLVCLDGSALGKPNNSQEARHQLECLSGRTHEIFTAVCVGGPGFLVNEVDVARLTVHVLSEHEIEKYIETREWEGCAGGYRIEARGQALFSRIDGDRTAIQGLPMQRVTRLLREARFPLW